VTTGKAGHIKFDLNQYRTQRDTVSAIYNIRSLGETANTTGGLYLARKILTDPLLGARKGFPKVIVLLVDGPPTIEGPSFTSEVEQIKSQNIRIVNIGVSDEVCPILYRIMSYYTRSFPTCFY